ncbi:DUF84 family protein [Amphibacillus sediminis]|uniref:DUF84 family protein n=1 Tax=Amphibacillus sediminis TaxID=360185 RepID=UPI0008310376|nr:DUF84 family protein [Amphibacillus sediminis]
MQTIILGSTNKAKLAAVRRVFTDAKIESISAPSNVSAQPFTDEETLEGAINRAGFCQKQKQGSIGIGLEGGIMTINGQYYLCNWGALVDPSGRIFHAGGARILLPDSIVKALETGEELGDIMAKLTEKHDIRHHQGTIGILTNNLVNREAMFTHVVKLLKGQYLQSLSL